MGRISDILVRVRDTLADPDQDRWSDARLIRLIDEAQKDIVLKSRLLRGKVNIPIVVGQAEYDLPSDTFVITRALFDDEPIPMRSHEWMDKQSDTWETDTGQDVTMLIFDKLNRGKIKVYPIPDTSASGDTYTFTNDGFTNDAVAQNLLDCYNTLTAAGVTVDLAELAAISVRDGNFGVVTSITDHQLNSVFGVVTNLESDEIEFENFLSVFGIVTNITEVEGTITIYYIKKPPAVTSIVDDANLVIDNMFDRAIKFFVTGMALKDDLDTQNRQFGKEELTFYDRELREALKLDMTDSTRGTQHESRYDTGIPSYQTSRFSNVFDESI